MKNSKNDKPLSYQSRNFNTHCKNEHCPYNFKEFCQIPIDKICPKDKGKLKNLKDKYRFWKAKK